MHTLLPLAHVNSCTPGFVYLYSRRLQGENEKLDMQLTLGIRYLITEFSGLDLERL